MQTDTELKDNLIDVYGCKAYAILNVISDAREAREYLDSGQWEGVYEDWSDFVYDYFDLYNYEGFASILIHYINIPYRS